MSNQTHRGSNTSDGSSKQGKDKDPKAKDAKAKDEKGNNEKVVEEEEEYIFPEPENPYMPYMDPEKSVHPEFIYGGEFIESKKPEPFLDIAQPANAELSGAFTESHAYRCLTERLPIILTKVIDECSKKQDKKVVERLAKLKYDLVTNKRYDYFTIPTPEGQKWNAWIASTANQQYYGNTWLFTECYVYRRVRESLELSQSEFDPFEEMKNKSFTDAVVWMCQVADKLTAMKAGGEDNAKADFGILVKIALWANRCDLALSACEPVTLKRNTKEPPPPPPKAPKAKKGKPPPPPPPPPEKKEEEPKKEEKEEVLDPVEMVTTLKDKLLADDTNKAFDVLKNRAAALRKAIEGNTAPKVKCSCDRLAKLAGVPICRKDDPADKDKAKDEKDKAKDEKDKSKDKPKEGVVEEKKDEPPPPPPPCPAKIIIPTTVYFDIVCNNAGYELFTDLCVAHFVLHHKMVEKVRLHLKKMPWFVHDATPKDLNFVINSCVSATCNVTVPPPEPPKEPPKPPPKEGEPEPPPQPPPPPPEPKVITAVNLQALGKIFQEHLEKKDFIVLCEDFWTYPHPYKDMKRVDPGLYRNLQLAAMIMFKGDLNYRKLLGDKTFVNTLGFEAVMNQQAFIPCPMLAVRTLKSELCCGLPKNKANKIREYDEQFMENADYGVIHCSGKTEPLKVDTKPCIDYRDVCKGITCPLHEAM